MWVSLATMFVLSKQLPRSHLEWLFIACGTTGDLVRMTGKNVGHLLFQGVGSVNTVTTQPSWRPQINNLEGITVEGIAVKLQR